MIGSTPARYNVGALKKGASGIIYLRSDYGRKGNSLRAVFLQENVALQPMVRMLGAAINVTMVRKRTCDTVCTTRTPEMVEGYPADENVIKPLPI